MSRSVMIQSIILFATFPLLLAACQQSAQEPASAAPDAADAATADAQSAPAADASANGLPVKRPSATDVPMSGTTAIPTATVGAAGYGALHFGMSRDEAVQATGAHAGPAAVPQEGVCESKHTGTQVDIVYLFQNDELQRIDVRTPDVMAEGGGHVGMQIDDIRTLYAGKLHEQQLKSGYDLKVAGKSSAGIIFETDAGGKVTSFRAGISPVLDGPVVCP